MNIIKLLLALSITPSLYTMDYHKQSNGQADNNSSEIGGGIQAHYESDETAKIPAQIPDLSQATTANDVINIMVAHQSGREYLMNIRVGEIHKEEGIDQIMGNKYLATSNLHHDFHQMVVYKPMKRFFSSKNHKLHIFARGIAHIEQYLLQKSPSEKITKDFELTRTADLYLLKKILENDNNSVIKSINLHALLDVLEDTHADWPPKKLSSCVDQKSGYTIVKLALAIRKAANIDENEKNDE